MRAPPMSSRPDLGFAGAELVQGALALALRLVAMERVRGDAFRGAGR